MITQNEITELVRKIETKEEVIALAEALAAYLFNSHDACGDDADAEFAEAICAASDKYLGRLENAAPVPPKAKEGV